MRHPVRPILLALSALALSALRPSASLPRAHAAQRAAETFVVKPYLQLGSAPAGATGIGNSLALMWQAPDAEAEWTVEVRAATSRAWRRMEAPTVRRVATGGVPPYRLCAAALTSLTPGGAFEYRVLRNGAPVFNATGHALKPRGAPYRFVVFGDCGENSPDQKRIAYQVWKLRPDFVFIPGDIVYTHGSASEYRTEFFPIYNADTASPAVGAPLMRSTLFAASLGNHDVDGANLGATPDGLAYYYSWSQPLNGLPGSLGAPWAPPLGGPDESKRAFLAATMPNYPRMGSFSFDYGNAHWTVIDSNPYADWTAPPLRTWLERDLAAATSATWRFVAFHHPGLGGTPRPDDRRMQQLASMMTRGNVDIVFNGHIHAYACSHPIRFNGQFAFDTTYDGKTHTKPHGTLYIVTGAGGAHLHHLAGTKEGLLLGLISRKVIWDTHCFTCVDVNGRTLTVRQIGADGKELDRFTVTK